MGRCPNNKAGGQKKKYLHKQARRTKFLKKGDDMIFDEVQRAALAEAVLGAAGTEGGAEPDAGLPRSPPGTASPVDGDLPGGGQHYCLFCDRHFASADTKAEHNKTKQHKRRLKLMKSGPKPHSQLDAELAAGMGRPDNGTDNKMDMSAPLLHPC